MSQVNESELMRVRGGVRSQVVSQRDSHLRSSDLDRWMALLQEIQNGIEDDVRRRLPGKQERSLSS